MEFIGVDWAQPGSERTVVTTRNRHGLKARDPVNVDGSPNSIRHHVDIVFSATQFSISTYRRPSKGYRKHLRRKKAATR
jgi:hypothetical protein